MKKNLGLSVVALAALCLSVSLSACETCGCKGGGKDKVVASAENKPADVSAEQKVCLKCGEIKDSEKCCKPDAEKCPKCSLNKGSIGCCKHLKPEKEGADTATVPCK
jgi:hypothetical protein